MRQLRFCILMIICWITSTNGMPATIQVGGLFSEDELEQQLVFHAVIERINNNSNQTFFQPEIFTVKKANSYDANSKTCELLRKAPVAIFGPFNEIASMQVQSICEHFEMPHMEARLMLDFRPRTDLSINLYPHLSVMSTVYIDLLDTWQWKQFTVLYEDSESIVHFREFFNQIQKKQWDMKLFQLQPDRPYRDVLWKLKETKVTNVILDVKNEHILEVLRQAQQVGVLTEQHNYLVTSLLFTLFKDLHTLDLEYFRHSMSNITSLRIVKQDHPLLKSLLLDWQSYASRYMSRSIIPTPIYLKVELTCIIDQIPLLIIDCSKLQSQSAMIYDGMQILAQALQDLNHFEPHEIDCSYGSPWKSGTSVINYVRQVQLEGLTGYVAFDDSGFRSNLSFDILSVTENDIEVIGQWKGEGVIEKTPEWNKHSSTFDTLPLLRVTTVFNDPFVMNTKNSKELKGNDRYEGYVVDLMKEIASLLQIRFEINIVKDEKYGAMVNATTNEWNGMIGEVIREEADIAVADLTINSNRELAVDFTYPFMATGISIIYKRPTTKETSLWSFLSPFSTIVWIYLLAAFAGISLILFYIGRFTPYEWTNPNPCIHHPDSELNNSMNTRNSFWCTIGSLMQQGSDVAPKALSTRVICAIWYFFTLIIVSSYTANLAAFLTVEKVPFPFENAEGLAAQTKIRYGCLANGSTHKFFMNSNIETYKSLARFMNKNPQWLTKSNREGKQLVEKQDGKYAFFMESATIEYITERDCNLTQIGGLLDNKGYGIATKKGSKFRGPLSEAILKLQETGVLQQLKDRWWKQKGGGQCVAQPSPPMAELGMRNLGGVFVVLVVGSLCALMFGFFEFFLKTHLSTLDKSTFKDELWEDFKFALSCYKPTKVVKRKSMKSLSGSRIFDNRVQSPSASGTDFMSPAIGTDTMQMTPQSQRAQWNNRNG
ncbi:hypothetical protein BLOT_009395 [Blomia tropicalis]|nr:hypothetical protein BLOT_009395 [Blomia tropicalis]